MNAQHLKWCLFIIIFFTNSCVSGRIGKGGESYCMEQNCEMKILDNQMSPKWTTKSANVLLLSPNRTIVFLDYHESEVSLSFSLFYSGTNNSNVALRWATSNKQILEESDIELFRTESSSRQYLNFSGTVFFHKDVGPVDLNILVIDVAEQFVEEIQVSYLVCGISFYLFQKNEQMFLPEGKLLLSENKNITESDRDIILQLGIQLPTALNSSDRGVGLAQASRDLNVTMEKGTYEEEEQSTMCIWQGLQFDEGLIQVRKNCSYGLGLFKDSEELFFGLRIGSKNESITSFSFQWRMFNPEDETYIFETDLTVQITSQVLPYIINMGPSTSFKRSGGDLLFCDVASSFSDDIFSLSLFNVSHLPLVKETKSSESTRLTFIVPRGEGKNVSWSLFLQRNSLEGTYQCPWNSTRPKYVFDYLSRDFAINSIKPEKGPGAGRIPITCNGYFGKDNYDNIVVLFGDISLDNNMLLEISEFSLTFDLPPFRAPTFKNRKVAVLINIGNFTTNRLQFEYVLPESVALNIGDADFNSDTRDFTISRCVPESIDGYKWDITALTWFNPLFNDLNLSYTWSLEDESSNKIKFNISSEVKSIAKISFFSLPALGKYNLIVTVRETSFSYVVTGRAGIHLNGNESVSLVPRAPIQNNVISPPSYPLFLAATLQKNANCALSNPTEIYIFTWSFKNKEFFSSFSEANVSQAMISAHQFGSSLFIPFSDLDYGAQRVSVSIRSAKNESVSSGSAILNVHRPPLYVQINEGENYILQTTAQSFTMSSKTMQTTNSLSNMTTFTRYLWKCELWLDKPLSGNSAHCPEQLFDPENSEKDQFQIESTDLQELQLYNRSLIVLYSLNVMTGSRSEQDDLSVGQAVQVVELVSHPGVSSSDISVFISYGEQNLSDLSSVLYFKSISIAIQARIEIPISIQIFEATIRDHESIPKSNHSLEVKLRRKNSMTFVEIVPFSLVAGQSYALEINSGDGRTNSRTITEYFFKTITKPEILTVNINPRVGTDNTNFEVNVHLTEYSPYFRVMVLLESETFPTFCADGCTGLERVNFILPFPGQFNVKILITSFDGVYIYDRTSSEWVITVETEGQNTLFDENGLFKYERKMQLFMYQGDYSAFLKSCLALIKCCYNIAEVNDEIDPGITSVISQALGNVSSLTKHTVTNSAIGKDYMTVIQEFASLQNYSSTFLDEEAVLTLVSTIGFIINNTLTTDYFNISVSLNVTLGYIAKSFSQSISRASSRNRLRRDPGASNEALLEFGEVLVPLWSTVQFRNTICGNQWNGDVASFVKIHGASYCTEMQNNKVTGRVSKLNWCTGLYGEERNRFLHAVLAEFEYDYVYESGVLFKNKVSVLRNESVMDVDINASASGTHGKALLRGIIFQEPASNASLPSCVQLEQKVRKPEEVYQGLDGVVQCQNITAVEYVNRKEHGLPLKEKAYNQEPLKSTFKGNMNPSTLVSAGKMNSLYGARWIGCVLRKGRVTGVFGGLWVTITTVILVAVITVIGVLSANRVLQKSASSQNYFTDDAFIDRDNYGRGDQGREVE